MIIISILIIDLVQIISTAISKPKNTFVCKSFNHQARGSYTRRVRNMISRFIYQSRKGYSISKVNVSELWTTCCVWGKWKNGFSRLGIRGRHNIHWKANNTLSKSDPMISTFLYILSWTWDIHSFLYKFAHSEKVIPLCPYEHLIM